MIPPFDDSGYLSPGIHPATLEEIAARFGSATELRRVQMESIRWMVDLARRAGVRRIVLNGSFVTDIMEPNDVDCVLLASPTLKDEAAEEQLQGVLPYLDIDLVRPDDFDYLVNRFFAFDRLQGVKGMIEVIL